MRKKIFTICEVIVLVCLLFLLSYNRNYADEGYEITEIYDVSNHINSFSVNSSSFTTNGTVTITNDSEITKSFDLLVFFESSNPCTIDVYNGSNHYITQEITTGKYTMSTIGTMDNNLYSTSKVLMINQSLASNDNITVNVSFGQTVSNVHFIATVYYEYNRYIENYHQLMELNNVYNHNIINNDNYLNDITSVYALYNGITSYDGLTSQQKENCYILKNTKYIWANSVNTIDASEFYYKTYVYRNVYNSSAFKDIYLLNDLIVDEEVNVVNIPCNIHLLYNDINVISDFVINHYYEGYYTIDSINGEINNNSSLFTINTPRSYYRLVNNLGITNENFVSNMNIDLTSNISMLCSDASTLIHNILNTNYQNGTQNVHTMIDDEILPNSFHNFGLNINYDIYSTELTDGIYTKNTIMEENESSILSKTGSINRSINNTYFIIKYCFEYNGITYNDDNYEILVNVVGTSIDAIVDTIAKEEQHYITSSYENNVLNKAFYLGLSNEVNSIAYKYFLSDGINIDFTIPTNNLKYLIKEDVIRNVSGIDTKFGYIIKPQIIINTDTVTTLNVTSGTTIKDINISLKGSTTADKTDYVGRFIDTFYLSNITDRKILIDKLNSNVLSVGIASITYSLVVSSVVDGNTVFEQLTNFEVISNVSNTEVSFGFTDIYIPEEGQELLLKTVLSYDNYEDGYVDQESLRTIYRRIIIPSAGIGGASTPEYVGNMFDTIFANNQEIIYSDGSNFNFATSEIYFSLTVDYDAIYASLGISDASDQQAFKTKLDTYFSLVEYGNISNPSLHLYKIFVNTENIPAFDTTIYIKAKISDSYQTQQSFEDNGYEQNYSFVIAGLYFCGEGKSFNDKILYKWLLYNYNGTYQNDDLKNNYLLVKEVIVTKSSLDLSYSTIYNYFNDNNFFNNEDEFSDLNASNFNSHLLDIKGIQYLINTQSYVFDGWKLNGNNVKYLTASLNDIYTNVENKVITNLSFKNCNLVNNDISTFNNLIRLEEINLEGNMLTEICELYRTVKVLNLNNQNNNNVKTLLTIENSKLLVGVKSLYLENNAIASFKPLLDLTANNLMNVYIYGNEVTNSSISITYEETLYGTNGVCNISVYKWLRDKGINVYNASPALTNSGIDLKYYYDSLGNVINKVYVYKDNYQSIIQGQLTDLVTSESYYGLAGNLKNILGDSIQLYEKVNEVLTIVPSNTTIYMRLPYQSYGEIDYACTIINSIMYTSIESLDSTNTITIPDNISTYPITVEFINKIVNNSHTITSVTDGATYTIIIKITYLSTTVYRELVIKGSDLGA